SSSSEVIVCVAADALRPPHLVRIDLDTGHREVMFDPNERLALDMKEKGISLLRWKGPDGQGFSGWYYPAEGSEEGPKPLFLTYYRCSGFIRGGVGDEWPLVTLSSLGIS